MSGASMADVAFLIAPRFHRASLEPVCRRLAGTCRGASSSGCAAALPARTAADRGRRQDGGARAPDAQGVPPRSSAVRNQDGRGIKITTQWDWEMTQALVAHFSLDWREDV